MPQTQNLYPSSIAADAAGIDLFTLKNWIKRGHLGFAGREPRAGHPRQIPKAGVYEAAFLGLLGRIGLEPARAAKLWAELLARRSWQRVLEKPSLATSDDPAGEDGPPDALPWELTDRSRGEPHIAVITFENVSWTGLPTITYAFGWQAAFDEIVPRELLPGEVRAFTPSRPPSPVLLINLTEHFTAVDQVLAAYDRERAAKGDRR